jgi:hypothetical protein
MSARPLLSLALLCALPLGCVTNTMYGTEQHDILGEGATEGDVIAKHGAPDGIVYLGTPHADPQTGERGEVDKYLFEYRIGGGSTILGSVYATNSFKNICYLIEKGVVKGGGIVGEGSGKKILYFFGEPMHWKARAGYGDHEGPDGEARAGGGLFGLGIGPL